MSRFLDFSNLRGDVYGGITAGIVALPLALAFGEASGAGPIAGLWGAIFTGFFASLFGGTGSQITGPTGPMVVVFAGVFATLSGDPALVFAAVVLAGLLQILFGFTGLGQYIRLVPYPVISGFMSGIGCIIIALQAARLFGHEPEGGGTIPALTAIPGAVMDPNWGALGIGVVTLIMIFRWPASWGRFLPGPLAALIVGTLIASLLSGVPILGDIPTGLPSLVIPEFTQNTFLIVLEAAFILAVLGAIDSLLTSLVADNMTRTRHDSNRELVGQGIGNTISGLFGAIPGAGATMRTVVNIRTGGSTKLSGMLHSALLLAVVVSLSPLASMIPHAVLAGILVKVGWDIIDVAYIRYAHKGPRWDLGLMAMVLGLTVFVDLITAVAFGVVMASLAFVKRLADEQLAQLDAGRAEVANDPEERALLERAGGSVLLFDFHGPLSFGAAADLGHKVRERTRAGAAAIVLDFSHASHFDVSAARAVETIGNDARAAGKAVYLCGMSDAVLETLSGLNLDENLPTEHRFETRCEALRAAVQGVEQARSAAGGASGHRSREAPAPA
ncbi:MAG: SulP family inorganic anion transporter [Pseudomonadales bacterium]|jgi:SulP family sulfate permease|nr:SulP family inorganic anion transporter [Pseudomonadales bacterium]